MDGQEFDFWSAQSDRWQKISSPWTLVAGVGGGVALEACGAGTLGAVLAWSSVAWSAACFVMFARAVRRMERCL